MLSHEDAENRLFVPSDGHVKFKIVHIKETNQCFVNLLANQVRLEDGTYKTVDFDLFNKLDLEMQFYISNHQNRNALEKINKKKLYALKDIETTIFKRFDMQFDYFFFVK
jgi:hypothetical protein